MTDTTEPLRRAIVAALNETPSDRETLERQYGQVWDTQQLQQDYEVQSFLAPYVLVRRRQDGARGTLMFQHHERYYFGWVKD
jgi:hypothetical protein